MGSSRTRWRTVLGLGLSGVLALTGCAGQAGGQDEPITYTEFAADAKNRSAFEKFTKDVKGRYKGKTLRIMGVKDPWLPAFQRMMAEFEKVTGAKVTFESYSYDDTYSKEVLVGEQKSDAVDVIMFDVPWVGKFAETGIIEPLDDYIAKSDKDLIRYDDFYKVMADAAVWDDKITGVPFAPYFIMQVYNNEILKAAGLDGPPKTMDDFVDQCHTIADKTEFAGTAINNQSGTAVGQAYFEYIYNMGGRPFASEHPSTEGDYYADMTPQFSSPESKATVEMFKELLDCQPTGAKNIAWQERYSSFATGQAAMISPWNYDIPPLDDQEKSVVGGKYGVQPVPTAEGVELNTPVGGWLMGINSHSKQKEMAWDFTQWFSSPPVNGAFLNAGGFAARYSVHDNDKLREKYPWLSVQADVVDTAFPAFRPQVPEAFEIMNTLGNHIGAYLSGEKTLDRAMADADREIGALMNKAGYKVSG